MALTASQIASKLFKKYLGAGETLVNRQFFEEPRLGRDLVFSSQVWSQSDSIPNTAPVLVSGASAGVVQYFATELLSHVAGSTNLAYFNSNLIDSIPFNFGDGTYNYQLFKNDGVTPIAFGEGDWLVDNTAGLLTFYGTLPSGVSSASPPRISFYKYIGTKGFSSGSGIGTITGITAGNGLSGGGTQGVINLDVNLGINSGLTFSSDNIIIDSNIAGNGLDFNSGVLTVNTSEITSSLAGSGLTANSGSLDVLVNSDSLEIISDIIRLKDLILGDRTFQDSVTIGGNLTVNGTVSYINTENLLVEDNIITLNATFSGSPFLDAGLEVNRGSSQSSQLLWDEVLDLWVAGLSGSTSPILINVGTGLTKSGNQVSIDLNSITGIGLTQNGNQVSTEIGINGGLTYSGNSLIADVDGVTIQLINGKITGAAQGILGVTAGDGLSGGGTSSQITLNVNTDNGLSIVSNNVVLGGTLSQNTIVYGNGNDLFFTGIETMFFTSSTFDVIADGFISLDAGTGSMQLLADDALNIFGGDISLTTTGNLSITATTSNVTISDNRGLVYTSDYSLTFVTHSLVTKKYVDDNIISSNANPVYEKKISLSTSGNNQPTGFTLSNVPSDYSRVEVFINGQIQYLGDGTSIGVDCYFWNGATPVSLVNLNIGDELYWNGNIAGFNLTANDTIFVLYES